MGSRITDNRTFLVVQTTREKYTTEKENFRTEKDKFRAVQVGKRVVELQEEKEQVRMSSRLSLPYDRVL